LTPDIATITPILEEAGRTLLLPAFQQQSSTHIKDDGSVVTQTDLACQHFLHERLTLLAHDIAFLGEEMPHDEQHQCLQSQQSFWCVDPLDGTSNFATPMPMFAISVALIQAGQPTLACIHDPIRQETFTAVRGQGCFFNGQRMRASSVSILKHAVGFVDFKRLPADLATKFATQNIYRSQRNLGSCALEWAWLAAGRAQFVIHGGEKLWDYAAGALLAEESGCTITDFNFNPLFHQPALSSSILAAPPLIHQALQSHFNTGI